jgi:tetratricopeptide (TPR) repeat protein
MPLSPPDSHHLLAAQGWFELGNHLEANSELDNITATLRAHPDVLELRWHIYAKARRWDVCLDIGTALVNLAPERPEGWRHRSVALHYLNRTPEAYALLLPSVAVFGKDWAIHYDMACYACVLGRLEETRSWLEKAFALGDSKTLKLLALDDPDLERLWVEIEGDNPTGPCESF